MQQINFRKYLTVSNCLIVANIIIFIAMDIFGQGSQDALTLIRFGALVPELVFRGDYIRLFTSGFLHAGFAHLLFNCYAIYFMGNVIEKVFGERRYVLIYFGSMLIASISSILVYPDKISVGASGAIFGLLGTHAYLVIKYRKYVPDAVARQLRFAIILNLIFGLFLSNINLVAHIGGFFGGFAICNLMGTTKNFRN